MAIFYTLYCQTEVGNHIVYIKGIPIMSLLEKTLGTNNYDFYAHWYLTLQYWFSLWFWLKIVMAKESNPQVWVYLHCTCKTKEVNQIYCNEQILQFYIYNSAEFKCSTRILIAVFFTFTMMHPASIICGTALFKNITCPANFLMNHW